MFLRIVEDSAAPANASARQMPIYQFHVRQDHRGPDPDIRWTYLPDDDAARRYAHVLIRNFKSNGNGFDSDAQMDVKDEMGRPVASITFGDVGW